MNGKKSKKSSGKKKMKGENHIISLFEAYFSNVDILCLKKERTNFDANLRAVMICPRETGICICYLGRATLVLFYIPDYRVISRHPKIELL